ncbi:MAG: hypothetical protein U0S36_03960 [Candidatus Nanopelagicales bacterium]
MIRSLAWVTADVARDWDEDAPLALPALARRGVAAEVVAWDDPSVDWSRFDRVVLRSPWDYARRLPEFLAWLDRVAATTDVVNPPATVRWSLDKRYLAELERADVPVVPTRFVAPGSPLELPEGAFVVKPAVGAGSRDAASYDAEHHDLARAHVARLHDAGQVVLVQPFLETVAVDGEWPMVVLGGRFSHTASKRVALPRAGDVTDLFARETCTPCTATPEQVDVAAAALDVVAARFGMPAYARVDLVRRPEGGFCVLELELAEPFLFLPYADAGAPDRLADALLA